MKDVDSPYSIFFSPDNILPLNHILYLPDIIFIPWATEASSGVGIFTHIFMVIQW